MSARAATTATCAPAVVLLLVCLKLAGAIAWPWALVFAPLWILLVAAVFWLVVLVVSVCLPRGVTHGKGRR